MKRILVLEGIDNTGKTWIVNRLKELYPQIGTCGFPSERLTDSKTFSDLIENPSDENTDRWLSAIYEEELKGLSRLVCFDIIVVDRFWFSTLIYNGSGYDGNFKYEEIINEMYNKMMSALDTKPAQMLNVLLSYPLVPKDDREQNRTKKAYDSKTKELHGKLENLILALLNNDLVNPYLSRFVRFAEKDMFTHWHNGTFPDIEEIKRIQNARVKWIASIYGLMT